MKKNIYTLSDAQLRAEMEKCEFCEEKPCREACPVNCSPADFIMAMKKGNPSDIKRAAAEILSNNPLGGICGMVCPEYHCQAACVKAGFSTPVEIPMLQATIVAKAHLMDLMPEFVVKPANNKKIAVIGAGPAGLTTAAMLALKGFEVVIYEATSRAGGACNWIPEHRLPGEVLEKDLNFVLNLGNITLKTNTRIDDPATLLNKDFEAVCVTVGLADSIKLDILNKELAIGGTDYLDNPSKYTCKGSVAIVGGGSTAVDCAYTAHATGAEKVEVFYRRTVGEMPATPKELKELIDLKINIASQTVLKEIIAENGKIKGLKVVKMKSEKKESSRPVLTEIEGTEITLNDFDQVIFAIGNRSNYPKNKIKGIFYAGDFEHGSSTVVEAVAGGKNCALEIEAYIDSKEKPLFTNKKKSYATLSGFNTTPVSLETDFFGKKYPNPFLLSAAPPSDGLEEMRVAYKAGWAGGVFKTAFKKTDIHIPGEYMYYFNKDTYANCDNVSGHSLERVCEEVIQLNKEYPDRLTIISTGGPVSGNDKTDKAGWQENTLMAEAAGAKAVEYSLSCPQGGDGTEGDIVSQNAALTAKIIDWVMEVSDPEIPKLFKLTPAVTSIVAIVNAIKEVLDKYPNKKGGITLANSFPSFSFRDHGHKDWEHGAVVGMSGEGVKNLSYLSLANVINSGVYVSGNGGVMDYKSAADFLALGCGTVQLCTLVMKNGVHIIDELKSGLSHIMAERGYKSIDQLTGILAPEPIVDFMDLTPVKKISTVDPDLCESCGNCTRCSYRAISLDENKIPVIRADRCIGCSICTLKCFSGALSMRDRTEEEMAQLKED